MPSNFHSPKVFHCFHQLNDECYECWLIRLSEHQRNILSTSLLKYSFNNETFSPFVLVISMEMSINWTVSHLNCQNIRAPVDIISTKAKKTVYKRIFQDSIEHLHYIISLLMGQKISVWRRNGTILHFLIKVSRNKLLILFNSLNKRKYFIRYSRIVQNLLLNLFITTWFPWISCSSTVFFLRESTFILFVSLKKLLEFKCWYR